jgi:thymidylate synthase (FAD)
MNSTEKPLLHSARLIHCTPDAEQLIAYCARVSNPKNQDSENITGLLRYCAKHGHYSIFEMASLCVEIYTTRAISAQICRHRSFHIQEFSQRYADVAAIGLMSGTGFHGQGLGLPPMDEDMPELRRQDEKNRQNSIDDLPTDVTDAFTWEISKHFAHGEQLYHRMLEAGIAKECARSVLPMHTPSKLYVHATLRDWAFYLKLRLGNGTQKEHQYVAQGIAAIYRQQFPAIFAALVDKPEG